MKDEVYEKIMQMLTANFKTLMVNDEEYSKYSLIISSEQQFNKIKQKADIYIIVKFLPATINFGQNIVPISFSVISEVNKIEVCQKMLIEYAQTYNLRLDDEFNCLQNYEAPSLTSTYNEVYDGFRGLFIMSGTIIASSKANDLSIKINRDNRPIEAITSGLNYSAQLDSQAFYDTDDFTKSNAMIGTLSFSIVCYLIDDALCDIVLDIMFKEKSVNTPFYFDIDFKNGINRNGLMFKLSNASIEKNVGNFPIISMTFTM